MLKLYKNNSKEGKNEIIMQTDCNTSSELTLELTLAFMDYFTSTEEVTTQDIEQILEKFLLVSLKLLGYKSEKVYEYRLSTCGYSSPEGCSLICETGNLHLDSYEKSAQFLIQKAKKILKLRYKIFNSIILLKKIMKTKVKFRNRARRIVKTKKFV